MLDKYLEWLEQQRAERTKESAYGYTGKMFRASGLGYCARKQVYKALHFEEKHQGPAYGEFSMFIGTALHEIVQDHLMKAGLIREIRNEDGTPGEVEVISEELDLSGHIDGIYDEKETLGIWDLKTTNSFGFTAFKYRLGKAKKAHICQVNTYAGLLGAQEVKLLYCNTNGMVGQEVQDIFKKNNWNQRFVEFTYPFDSYLFQQTKDKIAMMKECVLAFPETGKLPPKEPGSDCSYCPYAWTCKSSRDKKEPKEVSNKPSKILKLL